MTGKNRSNLIKKKREESELRMSMFLMSKYGGAVSLVLLAIVGVVAGGMYAKHTYDFINDDQAIRGQLVTEVEILMQEAITRGVDDFLLNGFSNQNNVWYCNYPFPVNNSEANISLEYFVDQRVRLYLDGLRERGFNISYPNITLPGGESIEMLDNESVVINVSGLIVGTSDVELIQLYDLSREYELEWPVWKMYKATRLWQLDEGGQIEDFIYNEVFMNQSCQIIHSACNCSEGPMISQGLRDSLKLELEDVYPALDKSLELLNDEFNNTNIVCNYTIERYHIENTEKFNYSTAQSSHLNYSSEVLPFNQSRYEYEFHAWGDDFTLPGPGLDGLDENGGCPTWNTSVQGTLREHVVANTRLFHTVYGSEESDTCHDGYFVRMRNEEFALDKKLGLLVKFYCEAPDVSIETDTGISSLRSEIMARVSVRMDCPTPIYEDVESKVDENGEVYACPGCFPAGTMITMADRSKKAIEDVEVGEFVLGYDVDTGVYITSEVLALEAPIVGGYFNLGFGDGENAKVLKITDDHPVFLRKGSDDELVWGAITPEAARAKQKGSMTITTVEVGDFVYQEDGSFEEISFIDFVEEDTQTYNLKEVDGPRTFFADDSLVHNKGGCCFPAGTKITLADGDEKNIEDVSVGDFVLTYNEETGELEESEVLELEQPIREGLFYLTFSDGSLLKVTNDHPLYTKKADVVGNVFSGEVGWAAVDVAASYEEYNLDLIMPLVVGDSILNVLGEYVELVSLEYIQGDIQTYTLKDVKKNKNFFADGFLAHNKVIGYVGPVCIDEIVCPTCQGCIINDEGDAECVPQAEDTECAGVCTVCDGNGNCNKPAPRGTPCNVPSEGKTDCYICDGLSAGNEGCSLFDPPEAEGFDCNGVGTECKMCAGDGSGCTALPSFVGEIDDCPSGCQTCGIDGTCSAQTGKKCGDCMECGADGTCSQPGPVGAQCGGKCERCLADGTCGTDLTILAIPGIDGDCSTCQKCGLDGCEADPLRDGASCAGCKTCSNGQCNDPKPDGTNCGTRNGCDRACTGGKCELGLNAGEVCPGGSSCAPNVCSNKGQCVQTVDLTGQKCCGPLVCDAGDPCCPYGGWKCGSCDDTTT